MEKTFYISFKLTHFVVIKFYIRGTLWTMIYITSMYFYNISKNPNFANEHSKSMLSIKAALKTTFVKIKLLIKGTLWRMIYIISAYLLPTPHLVQAALNY